MERGWKVAIAQSYRAAERRATGRSLIAWPIRIRVNNLGSTIALTDAAGNVTRNYAYDVDGNGTTTGSGPESWIKYAGGHDIGGGLYHFGARFYQPSSARWTQLDPLQQPGDLRQHNRYGYVGGDPINFNDPTGQLIPALVAGVAIRAAGRYALRAGVNAARKYAVPAAKAAWKNRDRIAAGAGCGYFASDVATGTLNKRSTAASAGEIALGAYGCKKGVLG